MPEFSQPVIANPAPRPAPAGTFAALGSAMRWISRLPLRGATFLIWLYQKTISPALVVIDPTGGCRFAPTCSHYAVGVLEEHGLIVGTGLTLRRLAKCGPWHPGGEDPVPRKPVCVAVRPASSLVTHHSSLS